MTYLYRCEICGEPAWVKEAGVKKQTLCRGCYLKSVGKDWILVVEQGGFKDEPDRKKD